MLKIKFFRVMKWELKMPSQRQTQPEIVILGASHKFLQTALLIMPSQF
jgi:predicted class III extradiol MEMO1 family dioxygenase